jgi:DNA topoisomerase-1
MTASTAAAAAPSVLDPVTSAKAAGLRYTTDSKPGIHRHRRGRGYTYTDAGGRVIRSRSEIGRIAALVIPPAWTAVWICPDPRGHLQATGRDARGRKQYRYHPKWREVRDETKYHRMIGFAQALPAIRRRTTEHLRRQGLPREKVLATVVQLLEKTLIRVGNDEYARSNRSYGLTTMRDTHVAVRGERVRFSFRGKSGVEHEIDLNDRRLARIVKQCRELPGYELFQYYDENGERQTVGSEEVNAYLKEVTGQDLTSKDFRTWAGTVLAAQLLREFQAFTSAAQAKRNIVAVVEQVAMRLGNTKAVCRKCYIHPAIFDAYLDGSMLETIAQRARKVSRAVDRLTAMERSVLSLLRPPSRFATAAGKPRTRLPASRPSAGKPARR